MGETTNNDTSQVLPALQKPLGVNPDIFEFDWLHNEALLRDEGAYYGLVTEQHPKEKLETIDSFFEEFIARIQRSMELQEEGLRYFDEEIEVSKDELAKLKQALLQASTTYHHEPNEFWRLVAGVAAYGLVAFFMFWLPYELFGPAWGLPVFITLGVFLFGLISHYRRPSWWYQDQAGDTSKKSAIWKVLLEETGIPVAATFFVLVWGTSSMSMSIWQAISYALLLLLFFLFAGKGLLNYMSQLPPQFKIAMENIQRNRFRKSRMKQLEAEIKKQEGVIENLRERRLKLAEDKMENAVKMAQLQRKKETYKNYFLSEFQLAKESRKHFDVENAIGNRR